MKKIISFIIILGLICSFVPAAYAAGRINKWVVENFENSDISHITPVNAKLVWEGVETLGASRGALAVSVNKDAGAPSFVLEQMAGVTYELSCYIRVKENLLKDQVQFIFQAPVAAQPEKYAYNTVTISNAGLKAGQWTHITGRYVCDGMGKMVGVAERVPVLSEGTVDIRLGDGKITSTSFNGTTVDYYLDDFIALPAMAAHDGNIVTDGDFESGTALTSWIKSGAAKVSLAGSGANGTVQCVKVDGQSNLSNLTQQVPIKFNTDYKISFWLKTDDADTLNKQVRLILDRKNSKTDSDISNYQYLYDPNNMTIGSVWTKYQIDYRYDIETNDTAYPNVYLRIGDGTSAAIQYYLDEISVLEADGGPAETAMQVKLDGLYRTGQTITATGSYNGEDPIQGYIVTVQRKNQLGNAMVCSSEIVGDTFTYIAAEEDKGSYLIFDFAAVTADGRIAAKGQTQSAKISADREIKTAFDSAVWTEADNVVSGKVTIANSEESMRAMAVIAVYDENDKLESLGVATELFDADIQKTISVSAPNSAAAKNARLFIWDADTQKPLASVKVADKVSDSACIYVDPQNGSDDNNGTDTQPFATIEKAQAEAVKRAAESEIYVMLKGGTYRLEKTLSFTPSELNKKHKIIFTSYDGKAVISGGKQIQGWELYDAANNIYRAYSGEGADARQIYVNGVRGVRARSEAGLTEAAQTEKGYTCKDVFLADLAHPEDLEMVYFVKWTNPRCKVSGIMGSGSNVEITMNSVGWNKIHNKGQSSVTDQYLPAYYENAYELLDEEGEWYLDTHSGYLYYKPRFFEDMRNAVVEMPMLEKLVTIRGTADNNAENLEFRDVDFMYSTWMDPTANGYLADMQNNHQSGMTGALPDAAIELSYVNNITFDGCSFAKLGITAMKMTEGVKHCRIMGNEFYDISGTAISLGVPSGDYDKYINPTDDRYIVRDNQITDNYIHHTGMDYKSAAALSAAFPKNTQISYNEIYASPYSGMHLGYGWNTYVEKGTATEELVVEGNYIHNVMNDKVYDGGAIYTMGKTSGTEENYNQISRNYIKDVKNHYGALYPDEGSQFWEFSGNVIDLSRYPLYYGTGGGNGVPAKWLHLWTNTITNNKLVNNYATTANAKNAGADNIFEQPTVCKPGSWPQEAKDIIAAAGIRGQYAERYTGGLQDVEALTEYVAQTGDEIVLSVTATTGKGKLYDFRNAQIYIENSEPDVAEIGRDFRGTAMSPGETVVRIAIVEKGILQTFEIAISVV